MIAEYEKKNGKLDNSVRPILAANAEKIAALTHKELQAVKGKIAAGDTPEAIAAQVAKNVETQLRAAYNTAAITDPLRLAVDGVKMGSLTLQKGMGAEYFNVVSEKLKTEISTNLSAHEAQFAALKPKPPVTPEEKPVVAQTSPPPATPSRSPSWMPTLISPAAASEPDPGDRAVPPPPPPAPPSAPAAPPQERETMVAGNATGEPRRLIPDTERDLAPAAPPAPGAAGIPSLSGIFATISALGADAGKRDAAITLIQNALNDNGELGKGVEEQIKTYIRGAITASGQNVNEYETDIGGFAAQIKDATREWLNKNQSELKRGNLSAGRIRELSNELAMGVRVRMTPEKVGAFAKNEMFIIDKRDIIAGVDAQGNPTRPFDMNIQSLAEAAIAGAAGDEAAKKRYKEQVAYEESHRAFYASEEAQNGVTAAMATEAARHRMRGKYSGNTQAAVEQMTSHAFRPSSWFSKIADYFMAFIGALFGGNLGQLLVSFKDGSFSAHRREKEASGKNFKLYQKIMSSSPQMLGYEGDESGFEQWRQELATDVTGIHYDPSRRTYTDINRSTGVTTGIAAISQGLTPDGMSRVEGMENVMGGRHIYIERSQSPQRPQGQEQGGAAPGEYDGGGRTSPGSIHPTRYSSGEFDGPAPVTPNVPVRPGTGRGAAGMSTP